MSVAHRHLEVARQIGAGSAAAPDRDVAPALPNRTLRPVACVFIRMVTGDRASNAVGHW